MCFLTRMMTLDSSLDESQGDIDIEAPSKEAQILIGGRPAFYAIWRMHPEIAAVTKRSFKNRYKFLNYHHLKSICDKTTSLLDSITLELVTYNYVGHWTVREQCRARLELITRGKDALRVIADYAEDMLKLSQELLDFFHTKLPQLAVPKIHDYIKLITREDLGKFEQVTGLYDSLRDVFDCYCRPEELALSSPCSCRGEKCGCCGEPVACDLCDSVERK